MHIVTVHGGGRCALQDMDGACSCCCCVDVGLDVGSHVGLYVETMLAASSKLGAALAGFQQAGLPPTQVTRSRHGSC